AAIVVLAMSTGGAGHDVRHVIRVVVVDPAWLQLGDLFQLAQVVQQRGRRRVLGDVALKEFAHGLLEDRRLIVSQLRLRPVLWPEPDLAISLPNPVALSPFPLRGHCRWERYALLDVQEAALDEELDRRQRVTDS